MVTAGIRVAVDDRLHTSPDLHRMSYWLARRPCRGFYPSRPDRSLTGLAATRWLDDNDDGAFA